MRVLSDEHAAEMQLLDLARLTRFKDLCFGAGASADALACDLLDIETAYPDNQRVPASVKQMVEARRERQAA